MAEYKYDQFSFAVGELDPKTRARPEWEGYFVAAKEVRNAQVIPQGGIQRRWGLDYVDRCLVADVDKPFTSELSVLLYDNDIKYLLLWESAQVTIYLENLQVAKVTGLGYKAEDIANLRFTQVEDRVIITNPNFPPAQLKRSNNAANIITGIDANNDYIGVTVAITVGIVYPVVFTTAGTLPTTNPQIYVGRTYFIKAVTANNVRVYATSEDAIAGINYFDIQIVGAGVSNVVVQNTWAVTNITFINMPAYDFDGGYSTYTFTPSATTGVITITCSNNIFTAAHANGLFTFGGSIVRFTTYVSPTVMNGFTVTDFATAAAKQGSLCFVGEPAWSAARGYPSLASFFQNRLVFANSPSLVNGVWLSVVNEAYNFDDSEGLPDSAISWYPGGGQVSYVVALTSARSLLVHTNSGAYSTPLLSEQAVTPSNFTLIEQNKFSCDTIQPIFIDNQIIFVDTASNVINMIWDISQSAYTTNNVSVMSSSLINSPVDMASFYEPKATDGFYGFFINIDGTMAVYQTLYQQKIAGWSLMNTDSQIVKDQNNGYTTTASKFIHIISAGNRAWAIVQRSMPVNQTPVAITAFTASTLTAVAHGMTLNVSTLVTFTTVGALPVTNPQIDITQYWFARALTVDTFAVYTTAADANADTNRVAVTNAGVNSNVVPWPLKNRLFIEEIDFDFYVDAGKHITLGAPSTAVTGLSHLNGNVVNVKGDGKLLSNRTVVGGAITSDLASTVYEVGLNFITTFKPLPISLPGLMGILFNPTHIRTIYIVYYQTVGAQFQGFDIPVMTMQQVILGEPAVPEDGVYLYTPMEGWNNQTSDIIITQPNPLPMTILGLSYILET